MEGDEAAEEGPTFHFHRFTFLLVEEQPAHVEAPGGGSSRAQGASGGRDAAMEEGEGVGVPGVCPAWVTPLSTHLHTFECEGVDVMESHLLQLRRRIEAPGADWSICARFLHPLLAACYPSLASFADHTPAFALPLQM